MSVLRRMLLLGTALAVAGALAAFVFAATAIDELGELTLLFRLRGARPAPTEVMVVGLDQRASARFSGDHARLRAAHAQLIEHLHRSGAAVVVFDLHFEKPQPGDADLAVAMRAANNVVLVNSVSQEFTGPRRDVVLERLVPNTPEIAAAALASAPFQLPAFPERVTAYPLARPVLGVETASLPSVAFHRYALPSYGHLVRLAQPIDPRLAESLRRIDPRAQPATGARPDIARWITEFGTLLRASTGSVARLKRELRKAATLPQHDRRLLSALLDLHTGSVTRYLNFYCPPLTALRNVNYADALQAAQTTMPEAATQWRGKVVLVGSTERSQRDHYRTVCSLPEGDDLHGVEIGATAIANLIEDMPVRPVEGPLLLGLLALWALALAILCTWLRFAWASVAALLAAGAYAWAALALFRDHGWWLPLLAPLLVQVPLALSLTLWLEKRQFSAMLRLLRPLLEYSLPDRALGTMVKNLAPGMARELAHDLALTRPTQRVFFGTCIHTDVEGYTGLAEQIAADELHNLMNDYFQPLLRAVRVHRGHVTDTGGDSMLAVWTSAKPDRAQRIAACRAALEIKQAADRFGAAGGESRLLTRVGLDCGPVSLGLIGGEGHVELRAFGEIVSTAQRVQQQNKALRTRVLATEAVLADIDVFLTRPLGSFHLPGKTRPVEIHELLAVRAKASAQSHELCDSFTHALRAWRAGEPEAGALFRAIAARFPEDGPTRYYLAEIQTRHGADADYNARVGVPARNTEP